MNINVHGDQLSCSKPAGQCSKSRGEKHLESVVFFVKEDVLKKCLPSDIHSGNFLRGK
jgi:hypothetical protein